ncbi:hypothetical protein FRC06_002686 [Ceratobasidium sp. 370]|nr:hypothetical protein FRC06_002686 [Ceratobasidium sp. 370]
MSEAVAKRGLNLLAIDGGGVRGLSALIILGALMERLQRILGLSEPPNPCDHFDLIAGTGTGGIQAVLLGRLGMSVDDARNSYSKLATGVFSDKRLINLGGPVFKTSKLEQILKAIIAEKTGNPHERMINPQATDNDCKVYVIVFTIGTG